MDCGVYIYISVPIPTISIYRRLNIDVFFDLSKGTQISNSFVKNQ